MCQSRTPWLVCSHSNPIRHETTHDKLIYACVIIMSAYVCSLAEYVEYVSHSLHCIHFGVRHDSRTLCIRCV
ncbi:Uncharacterized protein HZ326_11016 [Fusarium oxysporum f. sp. albedinis]|nr:Uncharacterized protein HZ326_11016 [Fusarium oxysporum f. sp. albedinis]